MEAKMQNFQIWINLVNANDLKDLCVCMLNHAGFHTLDLIEHHFEPQGYTALFLLSESHLAIHTFPEKERTYIELSSCVSGPFKNFIKIFLKEMSGFFD